MAAVLPQQVLELLDRLTVTAGTGPDERPVSWSTTTVRYLCPLRIEISSTPIRFSLANRSRVATASPLTRSQIQPTVRHAIRISCDTAVFEACTVSHATWSSNWRVNPESCLAHGTAATTTTCCLQVTRGRFGLEVRERRAEVQRSPSPAAFAPVIARAAPPAVRAAIPLARPWMDRHHQRSGVGELDVSTTAR
jgi:hypothetical protein